MAQDKNGKPLKEGDQVTVLCDVAGVQDDGAFGIVYLRPAFNVGAQAHTNGFGLNSKQVELVDAPPFEVMKVSPASDISAVDKPATIVATDPHSEAT